MISYRAELRQVIDDAIRDFAENGYDSEERLAVWLERIREAAQLAVLSEAETEASIRGALESVYARLVDNGGLLSRMPGAGRFTLERVRPDLRAELGRRIRASADLIKLNRERAIADTLQRFAGWASSVPEGGAASGTVRDAATNVRKSITSLPFRERRVAVDQGHKFAASLSAVFAQAGNAIAGRWHQHHTTQPRVTHRRRNGRVYLIRGSWAQEKGLVRPGSAGYLDEITQAGEEVNCRCSVQYLFAVRDLPPDMLTEKGKSELERVRREIAA